MKKITLLVVLLIAFTISQKINAANVTWTNAAGGNWSSGPNWSNLTGPGVNDTAVITLNGTYTVTVDVNVTCQKIVAGAATGLQTLNSTNHTIDISKGALLNANAIFYVYGTTFTGNNPIVNYGTMQLTYNNTFNININNYDTIEVWHYYNYFNQNFNNNGTGVLRFTANQYSAILYVANGFTNNGTIEFNSVSNYGCILYITAGTLINGVNGSIISKGIYNPGKEISGSVTNNGVIQCDQDLNIDGAGSTFLNTNSINIAAAKTLTCTSNTVTTSGPINFGAAGLFSNNSNTFTYTGGSVTGTGKFYFNGATVNFNAANIPGYYLEFYGSIINSTQGTLTNSRKLRFIYNNVINANIFNTDSIYASHQYNTFAGTFSTSNASRIFLDGNSYYSQLTFTNGFTNNGQIEFNSVTNYGLDLYITNGTLINAAGSFIKSTGIYNPAKTITGSLTNNGTIQCDQDLSFGTTGATFINTNILNIAAAKTVTCNSNTFTNSGTINFGAGAIFNNNSNTFTYSGGNVTGTGKFYFNSSIANFNTANIPGSYLEFYGSTLNSTQGTLSNARKLRFVYNNTINANIFNTDSIYVSHQYNGFTGTFSTSSASRIFLDGNSYYSQLTFANGFTNNGQIEFNSITNYGLDLFITNGTLINAAGAYIKSTGIYNPLKTITGSVTNNGIIQCDQDLSFAGSGKTFTNPGAGVINIAAGKVLANSGNTFINAGTLNFGLGATFNNNSNTFTYSSGSTLIGTGRFFFNTAVVNINTATIPAGYLEFYGSTLNSTQGTLTNQSKLRLVYNNTVNANVFNKDSIYASHQYNAFLGTFTTTGASRIFLDANSYYTQLTFANGFINNGQIEFNSITNYGLDLFISAGVLTNAAGAFIKSTGIYNPTKTITGSVTNNGTVLCDQDLNFTGAGSTFLNNNIINIASGKNLTNTSNTFTYAAGTTPGLGNFIFNSAIANFNVSNMPGKYLEFVQSTLNSNFLPITNGRKLRFTYNNVINAAVYNTDTIYISHYNNSMTGALTTSAASRIIFDCAQYYGVLNVSRGFTNNGKVIFNSISGYNAQLGVDSNLIINAAGGEIWSTGIVEPNYIYAAVNNTGLITCDKSLIIQKADTSLNTGAINISASRYLKYLNGKLKFNGGTASGPGKLVFENCIYEENLGSMPNLLTEFTASQLISNAALINNYGTLQFFYNNTITANVKNKSTGIINFSHYQNAFNGNFTNEAGSVLASDAGNYNSDVTFLNGFTNLGTINLYSISGYSATIAITNGELINNAVGTIHAYGPYAYRYLYAQLNNKGTFTVDHDLYLTKAGASHQNITGGNVTIASGVTLFVQNAGYSLTGGSITGAGFLQFEGSTYTVGVTNFPPVYHKFYTSKIEAVNVVGNSTTLQFFYNDSIKASINNKAGGVIAISHYINVMTGTFTNTANSMLSIDAASYNADITFLNAFSNKGTIEMKSISGYSSTLSVTNGVLINDTNATFNVLNPYAYRYYNGQLLNNGTLNVSHDLFYVNSSSFVNSSIGLLKGAGSIYLTGTRLINNGTIAPGSSPGLLNVSQGNATSASGSNLNIEIGGKTPGTQHDQFNVNLIDSISGSLNVTLINGYVPALGDSFIVSNYGSRVGAFSNITGTIPGGYAWNIFYRPTYAVIRVGNPGNLTITSSAGANGTITPLGVTTVTYNGNQQFTMSPNANYIVDSVFVDGVYANNNTTYNFTNVTVNHTIYVTFKSSLVNFTINATKTGNGTITPAGAVSVTQGTSQNFTFTPNNTCTTIDSVIVDGGYIGAPSSYNFTNVQANHTIKVIFKAALSIAQGNAVAVCNGDSISVSANNGFVSYLWSTGKTTQSIYIKTAGAYTVTVTGTGGCTNVATVTLTVNPLPVVAFTNPYAATAGHVCYTDGGIALNGLGTPVGGYYSGVGVVTNGFGSYSFSTTTAGYVSSLLTYTYTNANGCTNKATQTVIVDTNATVSAGADKIKCGNLAVQVAGTKGGNASTVTWTTSGTGNFNNASILNPIYTLSSADATNGGVTLTITTNNPAGQCGAVSDQMVITYYQNAIADAGSNTPICAVNVVGLNGSITGYPLATALWTSTGTGTFGSATSLITNYTASAADLTAGTVKLVLTPIDPNGSCTFTGDTLEVWFDNYTVDGGPNQILCGTSIATLAGTKSSSVTTTTWSSSGTGTFSNVNSLTSTYTLSTADKNAGGVNIYITTNDPTGPCGAKVDYMIISYRAATADAGPAEVCGDTIWQLNGGAIVTPGTTVAPVWSTMGSGTFNNSGIFNPVYTASTADKTTGYARLVLHLNDATGYCTNFVNDTIKVWFDPHYVVNAGVDTLYSCADKQVQLAGSKVRATSTVWSTSGTGTFTNAAILNPKYNFSNADTAAHQVTLYITSNDPAGPCGTVMDSIKIIIYPVPHATAGTNSPVCVTANLNLTASGGSYYSWTGPNGYSSTLQNIIRSNADLTMAGTYTVSIGNSYGCSSTATTTATIVNCGCIPPIILMGKTDALCFGSATGTATNTVNNVGGPFTYLWSNGATTKDITGLAAGTYTVTVSTSATCSATNSVTVGQPALIVLSPVITHSTCGNANGSVQMNVAGGTAAYSYLWNTIPAQSTSVISSMLPGTYTCTVTDANGCTKSLSATINNVGSAITALTIAIKRPCYGSSNGKLTVTKITGGTAPYTYLWSTGATTSLISPLAPGVYTVNVTDVNGCNYIKAATVTQRSQIVCHTVVTNSTCGLCNGAITAYATGGLAPYRYSWNTLPVSLDSTITGLCAAVYTLTITDTTNCKITCLVTVTDGSPTVNVDSITNVNCNGGTNGTIKILVSGGVAPYTFLWSNGKTTKTNANIAAGVYTVTVIETLGCTKTASFTVTQPTAIAVAFSTTTTSATANQSGGVSPYTFLWSNGKTSKTATGLTAGNTYTVTVTDSHLCTKTASILFTGLRSADENNWLGNVNLYPNPTAGLFNLNFNATDVADINFELRDALGRIIMEKKLVTTIGDNTQSFNIENLYDGVYELRILSGEHVMLQRVILRK